MILELIVAAFIAFGLMFITWLFYLRSKNPGVVDVSWGLGILLCGQWYLFNNYASSKVVVAAILLFIWGVRLSGFLWYTRVRPKHVEKRYLDIAKSWKVKQELGFFANFMLQAFLLYFIALPFLFLSPSSTLSLIDNLAILMVIVGIIGEATADFQLYNFKKHIQGAVCDVGLWHYSRHPNYFFEIVTWFGFALFVMPEPNGYIGLIAPLSLIVIMRFITGPITERVSLQSKGESFRKYQETTSMIIPWFKKKG